MKIRGGGAQSWRWSLMGCSIRAGALGERAAPALGPLELLFVLVASGLF